MNDLRDVEDEAAESEREFSALEAGLAGLFGFVAGVIAGAVAASWLR